MLLPFCYHITCSLKSCSGHFAWICYLYRKKADFRFSLRPLLRECLGKFPSKKDEKTMKAQVYGNTPNNTECIRFTWRTIQLNSDQKPDFFCPPISHLFLLVSVQKFVSHHSFSLRFLRWLRFVSCRIQLTQLSFFHTSSVSLLFGITSFHVYSIRQFFWCAKVWRETSSFIRWIICEHQQNLTIEGWKYNSSLSPLQIGVLLACWTAHCISM